MIKIVCDNCGKEVELQDAYALKAVSLGKHGDGDFGEFCWDCTEKIRKFVKEGFQ